MSTPPAADPTQAAYKGPALSVDRALYTSLASAPRTLLSSTPVPIRSARTFTVPAGHIARISLPAGSQVGDLNLWAAQNPRERFWAARTRQLQASHLTRFDRMWSVLPYLRPMCTIVGDSLEGYGVDANGGKVHDLVRILARPSVGWHS
jgi:uncharacterized protein YcgI (DUF1989 family)